MEGGREGGWRKSRRLRSLLLHLLRRPLMLSILLFSHSLKVTRDVPPTPTNIGGSATPRPTPCPRRRHFTFVTFRREKKIN